MGFLFVVFCVDVFIEKKECNIWHRLKIWEEEKEHSLIPFVGKPETDKQERNLSLTEAN